MEALESGITTEGGYKEWDNTGNTKATIGGTDRTVKAISTNESNTAVSSIITNIAMVIPMIASNIMTSVTKPSYIKDIDKVTPEEVEEFKEIIETAPDNIDEKWIQNAFKKFTILNLVLGYYDIFDIYFFDDVNDAYTNNQTFNTILKQKIGTFYYDMRNIAFVISAFSLIYIGIRMAISTASQEKARYKKLLRSWLIGFILIFVLQYIAIFVMELSKLFQQIIANIAQDLQIQTDFEYNIVNRISSNYTDTRTESIGFAGIANVIIYWIVIIYQFKFFTIYMYRELEIAILIIISPLITVTYAIDKSADGRSQVFNTWLREILSEIFLQNLHCVAYLVFVISAGNIAIKSPVLAILFFAALSRIEKIVKNIFKVQGRGLKDIKVPFVQK